MHRLFTRTASAGSAATRFLVVGALCLPLLLVAASGRGAEGDLAAIRATVFDYFDGINEVSRERLERAFDASAELKSVGGDGDIVAQPIDVVIERWMAKAPAEREGEILSMDVTDGEIARVVFDYNGDYIDFLTLAKLQGRWKIIDKVFITR